MLAQVSDTYKFVRPFSIIESAENLKKIINYQLSKRKNELKRTGMYKAYCRKASVYHFGQFFIKQISSAFLLFSLLNRLLILNLLLFYCNCFSSCLICIVKFVRLVWFFVDIFTTHKYLYSLLIFFDFLKTI